MPHSKASLITLALIMVPFLVAKAYACQCSYPPPPCAEYWRADAVFVGTVLEITNNIPSPGRHPKRLIRFTLEQAYRGVKERQVEITEYMTNCAFEFEKGGKYFVYAYRDTEDSTLITSGCSRTHGFSPDSEDLAYVLALAKGTSEQAISGLVQQRYSWEPFAGAKVLVRGKGDNYATVSDKEGKFKITVADAGKYEVRIFLPPQSNLMGVTEELGTITKFEETDKHTIVFYEVQVRADRCAFIYVPLSLSNSSPKAHSWLQGRSQCPLLSNNSFNRSGISVSFIREIECLIQCPPPG